MVTRIPQPTFIGSSPADVVAQAADTGTKYAQIAQNAISEGYKAYQSKQEIQAAKDMEAQKEAANLTQLRLELQGRDLYDDLSKRGPEALADRGDEFTSFFDALQPGSGKGIVSQMAKAYTSHIGGLKLVNMGAAVIQSAGLGDTTQASASPSSSAPDTQAPDTQAQAQATAPAAVPAVPAATPGAPLAHSLSENATELANNLQTEASNFPLMNDFRAWYKPKLGPGVKLNDTGTVASNTALLQNPANALEYFKYVKELQNNPDKLHSLVNGQGGQAAVQAQTNMTKTSETLIQSTSGVPAAIAKTATSGLQKLSAELTGDGSAKVTPKESAAITRQGQYQVKLLTDSPMYRKLVSLGADPKTLQDSVGNLQSLMNDSSPATAESIRLASALPPDVAKDIVSYMNQSRLTEQMYGKQNLDAANENDRRAAILGKIYHDMATMNNQVETLHQRIAAETDLNKRAALAESGKTITQAVVAENAYGALLDKRMSDHQQELTKNNQTETAAQTQQYALAIEASDPNLSAAHKLAAQLQASVLGEDYGVAYSTVTAKHLLGASFLPETVPAFDVPVPFSGTPPVGTTNPQIIKPAAAAPDVGQAAASGALPGGQGSAVPSGNAAVDALTKKYGGN